MAKKVIATAKVHSIPTDVREALLHSPAMHTTWEDITPLARNEWICWIISAKQLETRNRRLRIARENLSAGKRRPCCWAGCNHR
ncbi:MAG: YdeI/OmpD-associated family protein [Patescibacteria group bacterium]